MDIFNKLGTGELFLLYALVVIIVLFIIYNVIKKSGNIMNNNPNQNMSGQ